MIERMVSALVIVTGLISTVVGVTAASGRLRNAARAYRKTETLYARMPEGWASWFLGGFSSWALGAQGVRAILALTGWALAGILLIGLGLRLFARA